MGKNGFIRLAYAPSLSGGKNTTFDASHIIEYEIEIRERDIGNETIISFEDNAAEGGNSGAPLCGEGGGVVGVIIQRLSLIHI